jgi:periplasmic divalent cation tolerance protein
MQPQTLLVYCTAPDVTTAETLAELALDARLAACVGLTAQTSHYRWQGKRESQPELLMTFKTTQGCFDPLAQLLRSHHPYELPEIIAVVATAEPQYQNWVQSEVDSGKGTTTAALPQ